MTYCFKEMICEHRLHVMAFEYFLPSSALTRHHYQTKQVVNNQLFVLTKLDAKKGKQYKRTKQMNQKGGKQSQPKPTDQPYTNNSTRHY